MVDVAAAYASCERIARRHYENFPVASLLLPRALRPHIAAVYAFARAADDFADEGSLRDDDRLALLNQWDRRLDAAAYRHEGGITPMPGEPEEADAIFVALAATIHDKQLPVELFKDLLSAFRQDVTVTRYRTWGELLEYCRRSANPVGRLVLRIAGYRGSRFEHPADALCTALQLTNFWQDLWIDFGRGRIYVPGEEMQAHGATEADLSTGRLSAAWVRTVGAAAGRTRALFEEGRPVCDAVHGRLRYELRATWLGGMRILTRLEHAGFDSIGRPTLGRGDLPHLAWQLMRWAS